MKLKMRSRLKASARALLIVGGLALGAFALGHAHSLVTGPIVSTVNDFTPDYVSAKALIHGENPYAPVPQLINRYVGVGTPYYAISPPDQINSHPPALLLFFAPLAFLKLRFAHVLWFVITAVFVYAAVTLAAKHLSLRTSSAVALGVAAFAVPVVQREFLYGQIDGMLLLLFVAGWVSLRNDRHTSAGMFFGAAAAFKLFPLFLILPLLRAKLYRTSKAMVATFAAITAVAFVAVGPSSSFAFLRGAPKDTEFWRANAENTSFFGLSFRWLAPSFYRPHAFDLAILAWAIALVGIAGCIYATFRNPARTSGDTLLAALPWMLLATPLSWNTALILLIPYLTAIGVRSYRCGVVPPKVTMFGAALVVIGAPVRFAGPQPTKPWQYALYALPTIGLLLLGFGEWVRKTPGSSDSSAAAQEDIGEEQPPGQLTAAGLVPAGNTSGEPWGLEIPG